MIVFFKHYRALVRLALPSLVEHIRTGNWWGIFYILRKAFSKLLYLLLTPVALLLVLIMRVMRPWMLIRLGALISHRIGHFSANTELYLCERDAGINRPEGQYVDLWYNNWPISNRQLAIMWNRILHVGPRWLLWPMERINTLIPGGNIHRIGNNSQYDIDVHNLLDRLPPHLHFLPEEEERGEAALRVLGIPEGASFVCLIVRDSCYLDKKVPFRPWTYHDYRDCNIQNYVLAAQKLTERGYYVVRMGVVVKDAMNVDDPMIIDYATNGMRSDFMDIYLGAKCAFCVNGNSGFEALPYIFRRPMVYVDNVPLGLMRTDSQRLIATTKKHWLQDEGRFMTFREIFESGAGLLTYSGRFTRMGIELIESEPEEIAAVVLEMEERLKGIWQSTEEDEELQSRFWNLFPKSDLHGEIRSRMGADFLRRHKDWLE